MRWRRRGGSGAQTQPQAQAQAQAQAASGSPEAYPAYANWSQSQTQQSAQLQTRPTHPQPQQQVHAQPQVQAHPQAQAQAQAYGAVQGQQYPAQQYAPQPQSTQAYDQAHSAFQTPLQPAPDAAVAAPSLQPQAQSPTHPQAPAHVQAPSQAHLPAQGQSRTQAQVQPQGEPQALPQVQAEAQAEPDDHHQERAASAEAWSGICETFSQQVLLLAEQLRPAMDRLETEEEDPDRLQLLYQVDHAVTRMRRAARELQVLAGTDEEELDGHTTSLVDVIRMAESSIERYTQVAIGKVVQLAVVAYAAEDVAAVLVALLDNATRYSPSTVTVSGHLLDNGGVMMRIEDNGIGIEPERVREINERLAGPVPPLDAGTGRHTGFAVVHRLARKHGISVSLACRPVGNVSGAAGGTVAMVVIPPALLCEIPGEDGSPAAGPGRGGYGPAGGHGADQGGLAHLTMAHRAETPERPPAERPVSERPVSERTGRDGSRPEGTHDDAREDAAADDAPARPATGPGGLPRRESMSLRGKEVEEPAPPRREHETASRDPAAAALSFVADIEAFSRGERAAAAEAAADADRAAEAGQQDPRDAMEGPSA